MGGGSRDGTARYESTDPTLHNWTVADPQFYPVSWVDVYSTTMG
jgi:hypothetical protein